MADWALSAEYCRKPPGWGRRHRLAILGFCGFALSYAMRFSLSLAIVAMVQYEEQGDAHHKRIVAVFKQDICPNDNIPHEIIDSKLNLFHDEQPLIVHKYNSDQNMATSPDINSNKVINNISKIDSLSYQNRSYADFHHNPSEHSPILGMTETNISSQPISFHVDKNVKKNEPSVEEQGEFRWSEAQQGVILGSFFWGYILTQILGGWISQRIGGKWPFGIGLLVTGIFAILTPAAARLGGMNWLIFVRIIQGLAGGVTVPSMQSILSKWFPPQERGKLGSFTLAGMPFGTSMSMLCSGYLIQYFHWPSVFYVTGCLTIFWFILWTWLAHASPFDDQTIDQAELRFIEASLNKGFLRKQGRPAESVKVPWCSVLCSLPFWSILICNTCETWGLYTINAELPTYMKTVLRFDIKQNSVISAFPHLLTLVVSLILTNIGDNCIERKFLSIGTVRKLSTSLAMWGYAAALLGVAYSGCDRVKTVALLATAIGLNGGKFGGFLVNIIDIAPNYSGILMGIINTIAAMPGFLAPSLAGMIINHDPSLENWRLVFLITAGIAFVGNLFYVLFASGEEQSWNRIQSEVDDNNEGGSGLNNAGFDERLNNSRNGMDKNFRTSSLARSSVESINQVISSNQDGKNNKEDGINGLYVIPLNQIHLDEQGETHCFSNNYQAQPQLLPAVGPHVPVIIGNDAVIDNNVHVQGRRGQFHQVVLEEESGSSSRNSGYRK